MEKLLEYHMNETSKRFDELHEDIKEVKNKLEEVHKFKLEMIASSRIVSLIVSTICGAVTLLATIFTLKY